MLNEEWTRGTGLVVHVSLNMTFVIFKIYLFSLPTYDYIVYSIIDDDIIGYVEERENGYE